MVAIYFARLQVRIADGKATTHSCQVVIDVAVGEVGPMAVYTVKATSLRGNKTGSVTFKGA